jgi:hypothetical protein
MPSLRRRSRTRSWTLFVVAGPGWHPRGGGAEGGAAVAPGWILAEGDLQDRDSLIRQRSEPRRVNVRLRRADWPRVEQGAFLGARGTGITKVVGASVPTRVSLVMRRRPQPYSPGHKAHPSRPKRLASRRFPGGDRWEVPVCGSKISILS